MGMTDETQCPHTDVVPTTDPNWGRCTACGDSTFPLTAFAAGEGDPEEAAPTVRCEITSRGPRVIIPLGGEELVVSVDRARRLRDELTEALRWAGEA